MARLAIRLGVGSFVSSSPKLTFSALTPFAVVDVDALQLRWINSEGKLLAVLCICLGVGFVPICRAASALLGLPQWVSYSSMHLKQTK